MSQCTRCGLVKRSEDGPYVCEECRDAEGMIEQFWVEIDDLFSKQKVIPSDERLLQLCADLSFLTQENPDLRIFYKISSLMLETAWNGKKEITERELNRGARTTRSLRDVFEVLEELDLIDVRTEKYQRVLELKGKALKIAEVWEVTEDLTKEVKRRNANIFTGYILFYIVKKLNKITKLEELRDLPFGERPRKLWVGAVLLLSKLYYGSDSLSEVELDRHLGRRGVPSLDIKQALHQMNRIPTGLIKDVTLNSHGSREFQFADEYKIEMTRLREERERARAE